MGSGVERPGGRLDAFDLALGGLLALGLVAFALGGDDVGPHDPAIYLAMARDPLVAYVLAPFRFRVGTPLLVAALPVSEETGFHLVTWAGLLGAALVVRRTTAAIAGARRGRAAALLFVTSGAVLIAVRTPYASEPLALLATAGALELGRRRSWAVAGLVIAGGVLARESTLFALVPLAAWAVATERGWRARARAGAWVAVPGIAVYLLLHRTPLLYGVVPTERIQTPAEVWRWNRSEPGGIVRYLVAAALGSLGLLWLLLPRAWRRGDRWVRCSLLLLAPLLASTQLATDWGRVVGFAAVVVAPAVAATAPARLLAPLAAVQLAIGALVLTDRPWWALAVAAAAIGAWWLERRSRQAAGSLDQAAATSASVRTP